MLNNNESIWEQFRERMNLSLNQIEQYKIYYESLVRTNEIHNLTAITDLSKVLTDHFEDSLALTTFVDCMKLSCIGDVGTGAGFPALPIKIAFPHLSMVLIEVNHKKLDFLASVIEKLGLTDIELIDLDWRTFLRKTDFSIDLFCARASLQPEELIRVFKPSSPYHNSELVYWAAIGWQPSDTVVQFIVRDEEYAVGNKSRRLVFFKNK